MPNPVAAITHGNLTFVDIGQREVEVRHPEGNWNDLPGVCDRFALYDSDTFEEGVQDYIADMERS